MYSDGMLRFSDRPIEIIPDLLGPDTTHLGDRRTDPDDYNRMDSNYTPSYDVWRDTAKPMTSQGHGDVMSRSPMSGDYGYNASFPVSSIELEPLAGVFSFGPSYKEMPVFKDKTSHEPHPIADALLSLKHAVVHPSQMNGPLSPLSPTLTTLNHAGSSNMAPSASFSYNMGQHGSVHNSATMGGSGGGQYGVPHQFVDSAPSPVGGQGAMAGNQYAQHGMFPSMSVNVSMSMNVGMPPNVAMQNYGLPEHAQWSSSYPPPPPPGGSMAQSVGPPCTPPHGGLTSQGQYAGYSPGAHAGYHTSYSFADLRSPTFGQKDAYGRCAQDSYKSGIPRFYSLSPLGMRGRSKVNGRGACAAAASDAAKVNLCRVCGKTYARPSTLKTHMRTHSGEKPYRCSTCNKSFSQAANLTAHVRTHSGDKPFRCPVCERRFSQSSSVTTHMRTHSGERPYRCRMCKKAFSDSSTLTKHLRIHSGEKPYQCKLCLLRFSQSGNLNRHMRVHANNS